MTHKKDDLLLKGRILLGNISIFIIDMSDTNRGGGAGMSEYLNSDIFKKIHDKEQKLVMNATLNIIDTKDQYIMGRDKNNFFRRSILSYVHPEDLNLVRSQLENSLHGELLSFQFRCLTNSNGYRWYYWKSKGDGRFIYIISEDVSEFIQA